jgi:hypothetical protein
MKGEIKMKIEIIEMEGNELESILEYVEDMEPESEAYGKAIDNYVKIRKIQLEEERNERDRKYQVINQFVGYGLDLAKFGVGLSVYYALYKIGLKFEESGSISAHPMRDLVGSINPFKKLK